MQSGRILPGELTVELLAAEVARVTNAQRRLNPRLTPAFLVGRLPPARWTTSTTSPAASTPPLALLLLSASDPTLRSRLQARAALVGQGGRHAGG